MSDGAAYVPALHVQLLAAELPFSELVPAGQATHVVALVVPVLAEYVPAEQSVHPALPVIVLNLPATQAAHGPPSGPVDPGLHATETHAFTLEPPAADVVPAGHETHTSDECVDSLLYLMMMMPEPPAPPALSPLDPVP